VARSEKLIELSYSWFSAIAIQVACRHGVMSGRALAGDRSGSVQGQDPVKLRIGITTAAYRRWGISSCVVSETALTDG